MLKFSLQNETQNRDYIYLTKKQKTYSNPLDTLIKRPNMIMLITYDNF
jgi:hypothetical protein